MSPHPVRKFAITDASFERSPGQNGDVFAASLIDERHGGPITVGYGRYAPRQSISETLAVDHVMAVLERRLSVSTDAGTVTASPGVIVHMPKGTKITTRALRADVAGDQPPPSLSRKYCARWSRD